MTDFISGQSSDESLLNDIILYDLIYADVIVEQFCINKSMHDPRVFYSTITCKRSVRESLMYFCLTSFCLAFLVCFSAINKDYGSD